MAVDLTKQGGNVDIEKARLGFDFLRTVLFFAAAMFAIGAAVVVLTEPSAGDLRQLHPKDLYGAYKDQHEAWRNGIKDVGVPLGTAVLTLAGTAIGAVLGGRS